MGGADLAGVDPVVVEVRALEHAILVADQPVFGHDRRVELDLDLHILRDGVQRRLSLRDQHASGLGQGIDIRMAAIADIGETLHQVIVVIAGAEAERR